MKLEDFWKSAEMGKLEAQFRLRKEMTMIATLPIESLREILFQYRFFTMLFATDIAYLISRCTPGSRLRSLLAELLNEELGEGDPAKAHAAMFDRFLSSMGCFDESATLKELDSRVYPEVAEVLQVLAKGTRESSEFHAIGLRGLGGECVCGVYFGVMHEYLRKHPYCVKNNDTIDWEFWDIHAGHADVEHNLMVRDAVSEVLADEPETAVDEINAGYLKGTALWDVFWTSVYARHTSIDMVVATQPETTV